MTTLEDIPTECRRCHRIWDDSEMMWVQVHRNEKWWVCEHCADSIAWAERCIALLEEAKHGKVKE